MSHLKETTPLPNQKFQYGFIVLEFKGTRELTGKLKFCVLDFIKTDTKTPFVLFLDKFIEYVKLKVLIPL